MELAHTSRLALSVALAAACRALPDAPAAVPALPDTVEIASPSVALTFGRIGSETAPRVVAVTGYVSGEVSGVDLSLLLGRSVTDPVRLLGEVGYDRLQDAVASAPASAAVSIPATELLAPVDLRDRHIAAGTNYPEHAGES